MFVLLNGFNGYWLLTPIVLLNGFNRYWHTHQWHEIERLLSNWSAPRQPPLIGGCWLVVSWNVLVITATAPRGKSVSDVGYKTPASLRELRVGKVGGCELETSLSWFVYQQVELVDLQLSSLLFT